MKDRLGNEVPPEALPLAEWVEERGWHYLHEWVWPWEDEDGHHEGFWIHAIWHEVRHEWPREDAVWFFQVDVSDYMLTHESAWDALLQFAESCSERARISCRVPVRPEREQIS